MTMRTAVSFRQIHTRLLLMNIRSATLLTARALKNRNIFTAISEAAITSRISWWTNAKIRSLEPVTPGFAHAAWAAKRISGDGWHYGCPITISKPGTVMDMAKTGR